MIIHARPVIYRLPAAFQNALLAVGAPNVASKWVPVKVKHKRTNRVTKTTVVPFFWPTFLG